MTVVALDVATVLGGLVMAQFGVVGEQIAKGFLAFEAETFLYMGATDLIPETNAGRSRVILRLVVTRFTIFHARFLLLQSAGLAHALVAGAREMLTRGEDW